MSDDSPADQPSERPGPARPDHSIWARPSRSSGPSPDTSGHEADADLEHRAGDEWDDEDDDLEQTGARRAWVDDDEPEPADDAPAGASAQDDSTPTTDIPASDTPTTDTASASTSADVAPAAPPSSPRRGRPLLIGLGALLAAGLVGTGVYALTRNPDPGTTTPTASTSSAREVLTNTSLLDDQDARRVLPSAGWKVSVTADQIDDNSPQATCISDDADLPLPARTKLRALTSASTTGMLHRADAYRSVEDAEEAFKTRLAQIGGCDNAPVYLASGYRVSGLGDESSAVVVRIEDKPVVQHTVVLNRTGTVVNVIDLAREKKAVHPSILMRALTRTVKRQCQQAGVTCGSAARVRDAVPPAAGLAGWLVPADLPRISAGSGLWTTSAPVTNLDITGSGCEGMSLKTVSGPKEREQRTYLLTQDSTAPADFGVDEVQFRFGKASEAKKFATTLTDNIARCEKKVTTASVDKTGTVKGSGIAGTTFAASQKTSKKQSIHFRVAVITQDTTVLYLLATPDEKFDFTDEGWLDVSLRAAQRSTQA